MVNVLTVVARIRAAKGKADALAALLEEQAAVVRKEEPGCLVYRAHRSTKDPELFLFYEMYTDDAASICTARRRILPPTGSVARRRR